MSFCSGKAVHQSGGLATVVYISHHTTATNNSSPTHIMTARLRDVHVAASFLVQIVL